MHLKIIKNLNKGLENQFDYIIAGAGCAGLSLLMRMMKNPFFENKSILLIDKKEKNKNDRTWCFWETEKDIFESIVYHQWSHLDFYSNSFSKTIDISPYKYKMIRGIDFYNYVLEEARLKGISILYEDVKNVYTKNKKAFVETETAVYISKYAFSSIITKEQQFLFAENNCKNPKGVFTLLQHFKGWIVETSKEVFNNSAATFMDFRVGQDHGTTFVYVLPLSKNKALIEYTLFNSKLLENNEYDQALKHYIKNFLKIDEYTIIDEEYGIIPMSNYPFKNQIGNVVYLGTAGGQTKASSGFTFKFIQKQTKQIVNQLVSNNSLKSSYSFSKTKFDFYDSVLLNVLHYNKMNGDEIFTRMFKKNTPGIVLSFLDNETNIMGDIKILSSLPSKIFLPAAIHEIMNKIRR